MKPQKKNTNMKIIEFYIIIIYKIQEIKFKISSYNLIYTSIILYLNI